MMSLHKRTREVVWYMLSVLHLLLAAGGVTSHSSVWGRAGQTGFHLPPVCGAGRPGEGLGVSLCLQSQPTQSLCLYQRHSVPETAEHWSAAQPGPGSAGKLVHVVYTWIVTVQPTALPSKYIHVHVCVCNVHVHVHVYNVCAGFSLERVCVAQHCALIRCRRTCYSANSL